MHGARVAGMIEQLEKGESINKFNYVEERIFSALPDVTEITVDGTTYSITVPE